MRKPVAACLTTCIAVVLALSSLAQAQTTYRWVGADGKVNYSDQPPPANARAAEEKKLGPSNAIVTSGPDYVTRVAAQSAPVTLYSSADCVAECQQAREFLRKNGIPYAEKSLKTQEDAAAFRSATGGAELLVPTLLVGTAVHKGYEDGAWRKLLVVAGYPLADTGTATTAPR